MNAKSLLMIAAVAGLFVGCSQAANAEYAGQGGQKVNSSELQPATWFKARRQIQVTNETPIVNYIQGPAANPVYVQVGPMPAQQAQPTVVYAQPPQVVGGGQPTGMQTVPPGGALVDVSQLPSAGFQAYTPSALKRNPQGLPSGSSTNMLAGKMMTPLPQRTASSPSAARPVQSIAMQPQQIATYGRTATTPVSTNVSTQAKASVSGTLLSKLHH